MSDILSAEQVAAIQARAEALQDALEWALAEGGWRLWYEAEQALPEAIERGEIGSPARIKDSYRVTGAAAEERDDLMEQVRELQQAVREANERLDVLDAERQRAERAERAVAELRAAARDVLERMMAGDTSDEWFAARDALRARLREMDGRATEGEA